MSRSNKQIPLQKLTVAAKSPLGIGMIVTLAVIAATGGVAAAANSSKPGDSLYSVDTLTEKIQLALTPGSYTSPAHCRGALAGNPTTL